MWRLPGLLGRALPRLLGPGLWGVTPKSTNPAGPQAASSNLLVPVPSFDRSGPHGPGPGTNRGPRSHGWKDAFQWMSSRISPNTLWDAVSWGTLAVLALQLARQIHFQSSLPAGPRQAGCCSWHSPLDRFLSSSLWHPCSYPSDLSFLSTSGNFQPRAEPAQLQSTGEKQEEEKSKTLSLEEAVTSIQQLFQLTISIAFNFLGTENMRNGDYVAAFSYFQKAADYGYSKAQYNVGLCHEHGRGTPKDLGKAVLSYQLAASQGHRLAQYRYARCLLQGPASEGAPKCQRAVSMLKQAADSGLREAQAFLGVLFTKEPHLDEQSAVKYFWLAANNGDSQSRYHLGICFEKGLGVRRSLGEAVRCYQQSAALGNEPAQERLQTLFSMEAAGKALGTSNLAVKGLKSFSSPSLHSFNTLLAEASHLPHASTTGNLGLLCRSGCLRASPGAPNMTLPPFSYPLERSLVRLGFG
ncbi:death ligand signal enhancer isoform X4 [Mustela nigripes]|uniref:death ligand signal enhancer isoform X4 n=1 Tax=Mustela nigripes TaxID=77151 RepID=UPI002814A8E7|nr:death ligand signal enhancer isoform X4 [Mustela nigripes]